MSDWDPILAELRARRDAARAMGGPDRLGVHDVDGIAFEERRQ